MGSPVLLVEKKDGSLRMVVYYRGLNLEDEIFLKGGSVVTPQKCNHDLLI